jgi:putative ABC transport system permease protein
MTGFGGLSPTVASDIASLDEVAHATSVRIGAARDLDAGRDVSYVAVDPATAGPILDLDMATGSLAGLTDDGVLLADDDARERGLAVGDAIAFGFLDGSQAELTLQGTYRRDDVVGGYVVSHGRHEQTGVDQFDVVVFVQEAPGTTDAALAAALHGVVADAPNAEVQSRAEFVDAQAAQFDQIVNLMYALLALAVLIALINIANSLALSIHERTRELGLLRAVGTTRRQTSAAVVWEAVLVAVLGTAIGLVLGTCFGWSISIVGRGVTLEAFVFPALPLVLIGVLAVVGGVLASIRPAWRAAHLDVLRAIASE